MEPLVGACPPPLARLRDGDELPIGMVVATTLRAAISFGAPFPVTAWTGFGLAVIAGLWLEICFASGGDEFTCGGC